MYRAKNSVIHWLLYFFFSGSEIIDRVSMFPGKPAKIGLAENQTWKKLIYEPFLNLSDLDFQLACIPH